MKKLILLLVLGFFTWTGFAQSAPIVFKVASYQISRRQTANQYTKAELLVDDENQTWEIVLYRKDGAEPEHIKLENFTFLGGHGVFRTVIIREASGTSGSNLFAYMPAYEGNKIRIDLCDIRTEGARRRLIIEY
ncbi:MAG: hypothetical protein LBO65_05135 [Spirochaetaceae bacterium]|jgi:hypothetical protein|nr:hypothetical protein [Spirochaetaceae bacterium]